MLYHTPLLCIKFYEYIFYYGVTFFKNDCTDEYKTGQTLKDGSFVCKSKHMDIWLYN